MRRFITLATAPGLFAVLALAGIGAAPSAQAEPHSPRAFGSCAQVNAEYAGGVARTQKAADRAVRQGYQRPIVCPTAYAADRRLDRDRDGVICEQRAA